MIKIICIFKKDLRPLPKKVMEERKWIKTEQMIEDLRNDPDNEHEYTHYLGGILRSTHWLINNSKKGLFGDSTNWGYYDWYTMSEYLEIHLNEWWRRDV